jgi:hypothetical protein
MRGSPWATRPEAAERARQESKAALASILAGQGGEKRRTGWPAALPGRQGCPPDDLAWQPFPLDALPMALRPFVAGAALALGCDPSCIALPLLTAVGAAIGNSRRIRLKADWSEPPLFWTALVIDSGHQKSAAHEEGTSFTRAREGPEIARFQEARRAYLRSKRADEPLPEPDPPKRFLVSDTIAEALGPLLEDNPRGLLLARDELSGWLRSFNAYRHGKGADVEHFLTVHRAASWTCDRKTGDRRLIHVPRAFLAVTGTTQPATLAEVLSREYFGNGLAARLLLAMPPWPKRRWTEDVIDPESRTAVQKVFDELWRLEPQATDDGPRPADVGFTPKAKQDWIRFFNAHAAETEAHGDDLAASWSKLEEYCARLALILHYARRPGDAAVDHQSLAAGVRLVRWFGNEDRRVYARLARAAGENARNRGQRTFPLASDE